MTTCRSKTPSSIVKKPSLSKNLEEEQSKKYYKILLKKSLSLFNFSLKKGHNSFNGFYRCDFGLAAFIKEISGRHQSIFSSSLSRSYEFLHDTHLCTLSISFGKSTVPETLPQTSSYLCLSIFGSSFPIECSTIQKSMEGQSCIRNNSS